MRKFKNVSKRVAIAILAAAMMMSTITASIAMPVTVYAVDNFQIDYGVINEGEWYIVNEGANVTNNGTLDRNYSNISTNNGYLGYNGYGNSESGTVGINSETGHIGINHRGSIGINNGTVTNNYATVETNNNYIEKNLSSGIVTNGQNGTVTYNEGSVLGSGTVTENKSGGTVSGSANVGTNEAGGTVSGTGTVSTNYGSVTGSGDVTTNKSGGTVSGSANVGTNEAGGEVSGNGTITNNYGNVTGGSTTGASIYNHFSGTLTNTATITVINNYSDDPSINAANQYYSVTLTGFDNSEAVHTDGFEDTNSKKYLKSTNNGIITITPSEGYEVRGNMGANQAGTNFTYSLERDGNIVRVTLSSPEGAVTISPEALNLIIALIQQVNPDPQSQPQPQQQAEAQPQPVQIIVRVVDETGGSSDSNSQQQMTVIDIYLGDEPSLDADAVKKLCVDGVAKRCHFTHEGKKYILYVPVVDMGSTTFANCMALLANEPGGSAGPIKLSQIFAPCGFTVSEE